MGELVGSGLQGVDFNPLTTTSLFVLLLSHICLIAALPTVSVLNAICFRFVKCLRSCGPSLEWSMLDPGFCQCVDYRSCVMSPPHFCHPSVLQVLLVGNSLFKKDHGSVIFQLNLIRKADL